MAFHETLRAIRLTKGLTQPALAEAAQIEQSYLSKLENGRSSPSDEVLARLAAALGTPAEELMRNGAEPASRPWLDPKLIGAVVALVAVAAAGGWFAHDRFAPRLTGARAESRVNGSLTERLHALTPAGLKLEAVAIDDDGTVTITGHMVDRESLTAYLAELRRADIGEATLLQISNSDTRFHLRLAPFAPPAAAAGTAPVTSP